MPLLVCSSFLLSLSALLSFSLLFAPWLSLRHFDRNEDHDNRRNEHADRKKDRSKDRRDDAAQQLRSRQHLEQRLQQI